MHDPVTSVFLILLTLASIVASGAAMYQLVHPSLKGKVHQLLAVLLWIMPVVAGLVFLYRWVGVTKQWQPLEAHVDGLVLIATLLSGTLLFIQSRKRLFGISAFALPILTVFFAWSICAAAWTYRPFEIDSLHPVWRGVHLIGVYLGTLGAGVAAVAGAMFLYVQGRLKHKSDLATLGRFASLETLEQLIIRGSTIGFALLTLGLASGAVIISNDPGRVGAGGFWIKITISAAVWVVYALLMNIRYATAFRGSRAAWLSIFGLVLLLSVYAVINAMPSGGVG